MNLEQLLEQLQPTTLSDIELPQYLMGSFRRKSITFLNFLRNIQVEAFSASYLQRVKKVTLHR